jgi:DNA-binding NarL/FixJ family response regulator
MPANPHARPEDLHGEHADLGRAVTRILVAAASALYRDGVLAAIGDDKRFLVIGSAEDEREFIWKVIAEKPDLALLDVELLRAMAEQGLLPAANGGPPLVVLNVSEQEEDITTCVDAGAADIVRRRADRQELLATIDRTLEGESHLTSLRDAMTSDNPVGSASSTPASLTPRELEILRLIEKGLTNKAIALELGCSQSTVKNHVHALLSKLGTSRRAEAARVARETLGVG